MSARQLLSNVMQYSGANAAALAGRRESLTVLCYHRVLDVGDPRRDRAHPALVTSTHVFERQMQTIADTFHPVSLSDAVRWMEGSGSIAGRAVLITFDDGWSDNYVHAFPVMRQLGIPGVVFLATDLIGTDERQWADAVYESISVSSGAEAAAREVERLKNLPQRQRGAGCGDRSPSVTSSEPSLRNLTWSQVEEMAAHGFEFGSHTRSHLILPHEPDEDVREELLSSAELIRRRLGRAPIAFAYPDGQTDERIEGLVEGAGYRCAFGFDEGLIGRAHWRFALPRLGIHDGISATSRGDFSHAMFMTYLAGTLPWRYRRDR